MKLFQKFWGLQKICLVQTILKNLLFAQVVANLPAMRLRGLMAIPPAGEEARRYFAGMRAVFESLKRDLPACFDTLSMGMSHDYAEAVEEGATIVRVGTAIFGPRYYPPAGREEK